MVPSGFNGKVMIKIGDLVKFANGNPKEQAVGIVLPPVEGMSRFWTNTTDGDMVNVFFPHTGRIVYRKDYLEVVK